jgi:hypothetical protein
MYRGIDYGFSRLYVKRGFLSSQYKSEQSALILKVKDIVGSYLKSLHSPLTLKIQKLFGLISIKIRILVINDLLLNNSVTLFKRSLLYFRMLYEFKGSICFDDEDAIPLSESTLLLRGAKLKNTPWIHGIVVYSGITGIFSNDPFWCQLYQSLLFRM